MYRFQKTNKYYVFKGKVNTNPKLSDMSNGMTPTDLRHGFEKGNFGCDILFDPGNDDPSIVLLVTWAEVLLGGRSGIQVWTKRNLYRNLFSEFKNRQKTETGLFQLLNVLSDELFGDRIQLAGLLNCYYRIMLILQTSQHNKLLSSPISTCISIIDPSIAPLLERIESTFKSAIKSCFDSFSVISEPIVPSSAINKLIDLYSRPIRNSFRLSAALLSLIESR